MQGRETVLPITGISTGVNDPNGTESQLYGGKIRQGKARINQASRNSRDATGRCADAWGTLEDSHIFHSPVRFFEAHRQVISLVQGGFSVEPIAATKSIFRGACAVMSVKLLPGQM